MSDGTLTFEKQNEEGISFAPSFKKEDGKLNFKTKNAQQVINQIRGLVPWPGCFFDNGDVRIKVHEACLSDKNLAPGEIKNINNQLIAGTLEGSVRLKQIQVPGKKSCLDKDFLKGYRGGFTNNEN